MCIVAAPALAGIGLALQAGSMVMGFIGSQQQAKAAQEQANYQAAIDRNNATLAQYQANDARARGAEEEDKHRDRVRRMIGEQRAGIGASGFSLSDETSQDILGDTAYYGEIDAFTIRNNAEREAWGYEAQAANYNAQANLTQLRGENQAMAARWSGVSDLLGGATKFASSYGSASKQFGWGTA